MLGRRSRLDRNLAKGGGRDPGGATLVFWGGQFDIPLFVQLCVERFASSSASCFTNDKFTSGGYVMRIPRRQSIECRLWRLRAKFCGVGLSCCFLGATGAVAQDAAILDGVLVSTFYNGGVTPEGELRHGPGVTNEVRITVSRDGKWAFEAHTQHDADDPMFGKTDAEYMTFDGTDCYWARFTEADRGKKNNRPGSFLGTTPITEKGNMSYLSKGNYPACPLDDSSKKYLQVLWIAFGAGSTVHADSGKEIPLPWLSERTLLLAYGFRPEADLSDDPPYIPHRLRFVRDTNLDLPNFEAEMNREQLDRPSDSRIRLWKEEQQTRKTYWTNGFVAGELRASNFTNWHGMTLPLAFVFDDFNPVLASPEKLRDRYACTITNVMDAPPGQSYQPAVLAKLRVIDSRIRYRDEKVQIDSTVYFLPSNIWITANDPRLKKTFQSLLTSQDSARFLTAATRRRRIVLMLIFVLLALALPALLYRHARSKDKSPHIA